MTRTTTPQIIISAAAGTKRQAEKRKVGSSILPLTTVQLAALGALTRANRGYDRGRGNASSSRWCPFVTVVCHSLVPRSARPMIVSMLRADRLPGRARIAAA
jgi:hypothetical protein